MVRMSTDLVFACPTRNATRYIRSRGLSHVWLYVWDHAFSFPGWGPVAECEGRVCHGSELVYVFHSEWAGNYTFTHDEQVLSGLIMDFWTNFAKSGNPNFAESRNPNFAESWKVNSAESGNLNFAESAGNPSFAEPRNPSFAEPRKPNFEESENPNYVHSGYPSLVDDSSRVVKKGRMDEKVVWPAYDANGNWPNFRFKSPAGGVEVNYKGDNCDFWDTIGYAA